MSPGSYETVETDALVLGARGAGLRGAIAAAEAGARVLVICKSLLGKAHTVMAEGGVAAAMHNVAYQDTWEVHFADTMKGGKLINDWCMAEIHSNESPERVLKLERWGAVFDRTWEAAPTSGLLKPTPIRASPTSGTEPGSSSSAPFRTAPCTQPGWTSTWTRPYSSS